MMTLEVNKRGAILTALILISIAYILYSTSDEIIGSGPGQPDAASSNERDNALLHAQVEDMEKGEDDDEIEIGVDVEYVEDYVTVGDTKVYYRYAISSAKDASPPRFPVLLLHGQKFSSQTWKSLGTLQFLRKSNYFPVAIDLPGFGKTLEAYNGKKENFLGELIAELPYMKKPVIVSPSMSGIYSLPFVLHHADDLRGFIPVAPVNNFEEEDFKKVALPALIIYGGDDYMGKKTSLLLGNIPNSQVEEIPEASHPAYMDDPVKFHTLVKTFLDDIYDKERRSKGVNHDFDNAKL